jgi:hypothetical protein
MAVMAASVAAAFRKERREINLSSCGSISSSFLIDLPPFLGMTPAGFNHHISNSISMPRAPKMENPGGFNTCQGLTRCPALPEQLIGFFSFRRR